MIGGIPYVSSFRTATPEKQVARSGAREPAAIIPHVAEGKRRETMSASRNPPIYPVPRGKTHEVRIVDLLPEGKYRDFSSSEQVSGCFSVPRVVVGHHHDKIITTWSVNAHNSKECRNPMSTEVTLNPTGSVSDRGERYNKVKARSKLDKIERWAHEHSADYYEHSDHSPEAEAARERAAAQAQRERQAIIDEANRQVQAQAAQMAQEHQAALQAQRDQMTQAHQDEINRLREELAGRGTEVDELNQQVEDQRAHLDAKDQELEDLRSHLEAKQADIHEAQVQLSAQQDEAAQQRDLVEDLERRLHQLQAQQTRNGGYQVGEDDIHFGEDEDDDAGYSDNGGAGGGIPADGAGGGGIPAEQQQRRRRGPEGMKKAAGTDDSIAVEEEDAVGGDDGMVGHQPRMVDVGVDAAEGDFVTREEVAALMVALEERMQDGLRLDRTHLHDCVHATGKKDKKQFVAALKTLQNQINAQKALSAAEAQANDAVKAQIKALLVGQKIEKIGAAMPQRGRSDDGSEESSDSYSEQSSEDDDGGEHDRSRQGRRGPEGMKKAADTDDSIAVEEEEDAVGGDDGVADHQPRKTVSVGIDAAGNDFVSRDEYDAQSARMEALGLQIRNLQSRAEREDTNLDEVRKEVEKLSDACVSADLEIKRLQLEDKKLGYEKANMAHLEKIQGDLSNALAQIKRLVETRSVKERVDDECNKASEGLAARARQP